MQAVYYPAIDVALGLIGCTLCSTPIIKSHKAVIDAARALFPWKVYVNNLQPTLFSSDGATCGEQEMISIIGSSSPRLLILVYYQQHPGHADCKTKTLKTMLCQ